jgi:hypothetical protein
LRISLGGGGTDLPSYYEEHGGFLVAGAIDKYIHINIHRRFIDRFLLKYSQIEESETIAEIKHPIIRESLSLLEIKEKNLEMTSMADIPAGTGLGSSGSFTTALLKALQLGLGHFKRPENPQRKGRFHHFPKSAPHKRSRHPQPRVPRSGRYAGLRRPHARALARQARPIQRNEQRPHKRLV